MKNKYGPWALITGAAKGLGAEFAMQIAEQGIHIIGVDIDKIALNKTLEQVQEKTKVQAKSIQLDLGASDFMENLLVQIEDLEIGLLVNNAGISNIGYFANQEIDFLQTQLRINVEAVLKLSHHFSKQMIAQKRGGIIILSSGAGQLSSAYNASYASTKAYGLSLAESLWAELKPFNIDVLGFMPGPTKTPGYVGQGGNGDAFMVMSTKDSVKQALAALGKKPSHYAATLFFRLTHQIITRFISTKLRIKIVSNQIKKMFKIGALKTKQEHLNE
jgi:short-subunit dehydrogenase